MVKTPVELPENSSNKRPRKILKILAIVGLGTVVSAVALGGLAYAGNWGHGGHDSKRQHMTDMFEKFDADGDGKITKAEIVNTRQAIFAGADNNNDDGLSLAEFEGLLLEQMRPMVVDKFQWLDDDGDGQITVAELAKPMDRMVGWLDKNDDGAIEMKELKHKRHGGYGDHDDDDDDDS